MEPDPRLKPNNDQGCILFIFSPYMCLLFLMIGYAMTSEEEEIFFNAVAKESVVDFTKGTTPRVVKRLTEIG